MDKEINFSQVINIDESNEKMKSESIVSGFWTDNRITLIAYQAKFMHNRKTKNTEEIEEQMEQLSLKKKKREKPNVELKYDSAFLNISPLPSENVNLKKVVQKFNNLKQLWEDKQENSKKVKEFLNLMLQLKHSLIVEEFCNIYNRILQNIKTLNFSEIIKSEMRFQKLEVIKGNVVDFMKSNKALFSYFSTYFEETPIETQKLILVTIYCILGEKFNFHINEFYSDAFDITNLDGEANKKVKKN